MNAVTAAEAHALARLRYWMHRLNELLKVGAFQVPVHLGFGYEAAAVGMDLTMEADDLLCLTHRNAAYNLARSKSLSGVIAQYRLEPRADGLAPLGSMNLAMPGSGIAYSSSILGNDLAVASGIAMHRRLVSRPGVVFVATGDGGIEEGVFWESLIFMRSHGLPTVVVVENNDCSMSSTIAQRRCPIDLSKVCEGLGIEYHHESGVSLPAVKHVLGTARQRAGSGRPVVVELAITTYNQHAGPTPGWPTDPMRLSIDDGLIVGEASGDPLALLREVMGAEAFDRLAADVMREGDRD